MTFVRSSRWSSGDARRRLVETTWTDGPTDGLGAMIGAWWCDAEAERTGVTLPEIELMAETGRYNEVDCRSMAEVLAWLRGRIDSQESAGRFWLRALILSPRRDYSRNGECRGPRVRPDLVLPDHDRVDAGFF